MMLNKLYLGAGGGNFSLCIILEWLKSSELSGLLTFPKNITSVLLKVTDHLLLHVVGVSSLSSHSSTKLQSVGRKPQKPSACNVNVRCQFLEFMGRVCSVATTQRASDQDNV